MLFIPDGPYVTPSHSRTRVLLVPAAEASEQFSLAIPRETVRSLVVSAPLVARTIERQGCTVDMAAVEEFGCPSLDRDGEQPAPAMEGGNESGMGIDVDISRH